MNVEIFELYELYFKNIDNHKIFLDDLEKHHCCFCWPEKKLNFFYSKTDVNKIILQYLDHLKLIISPSWEKVKYFFKSVRISGFFNDNNVGWWKLERWDEKNTYILCYFPNKTSQVTYFY